MGEILVSDIMTRDPITVKPETNLLECAKQIVRKRVGSILITQKKKLVGIISEKDILWALIKKSKEDLSKIKAIEISPKKIATIQPFSTIKDTIKKMNKFKFDKLPVIQKKELVGVVTVRDILNFHPELYKEIDEFAQIREETKKFKRIKKAKERKSMHEGICEECGNQDFLRKVDGRVICESCRDAM
ncbi:MAG: CBS domain-containing protein [Nanoarchaeota archaeon]|nr:CBS domain-containing protein [Nanoarchaeota archaeon]MBU1027707.1 CBS domain-containing protein [Nanoarchaeota archaeon]